MPVTEGVERDGAPRDRSALGMIRMPQQDDETPSILDPDTIERLLRDLEATDIDELEVVQGDARVYIRREPGQRASYLPGRVADVSTPEPGVPVTAPLTGIFYARPSPEQALFVTVGAAVEAGQVVALIETMKLFNEVTAEFSGEVTRIAVDDGDLVEAGQVLLYIRPHEAEENP